MFQFQSEDREGLEVSLALKAPFPPSECICRFTSNSCKGDLQF